MDSLFPIILYSSFAGSIVGLALLGIKKALGKYLNAKWHFLLWSILVIKLMVPFGPQSSFSFFNLAPGKEPLPQAAALIENHANALSDSGPEVISDIPLPVNNIPPPAESIRLYRIIGSIWVLGVVLFLLWIGIVNLLFYRWIKITAKEIACPPVVDLSPARWKGEPRIYIMEGLSSSALYGLLRPIILLPKADKAITALEQSITYSLLHELAHYRRRDHWANGLTLILQAVYWFNPVVGYCFHRMRQDMELAADEKALSWLGAEQYPDYGYALIQMMALNTQGRSMPLLLGMTDGKKGMEKRLRSIREAMDMQKNKTKAAATGICLCLLCSIFFLTGGVPAYSGALPLQDAPYGNIEAVYNKYINDFSMNIKEIVEAFPALSEFHTLDMVRSRYSAEYAEAGALDFRGSDDTMTEISLYYSYKEDISSAELNPFATSCAENNAMILFVFFDHLESVSFAFNDKQTSLEDMSDSDLQEVRVRYYYLRSDFTDAYGDLARYREDFDLLSQILTENRKVDASYMHYNRIDLGSLYDWIVYRNGEPDAISSNEDGTTTLTYYGLGETTVTTGEGEEEKNHVIVGTTAIFDLDEQGVLYKVTVQGRSEVFLNLNITKWSYDEVVERIGPPTEESRNGATINARYLLKGPETQYLFFTFYDNVIMTHGFVAE